MCEYIWWILLWMWTWSYEKWFSLYWYFPLFFLFFYFWFILLIFTFLFFVFNKKVDINESHKKIDINECLTNYNNDNSNNNGGSLKFFCEMRQGWMGLWQKGDKLRKRDVARMRARTSRLWNSCFKLFCNLSQGLLKRRFKIDKILVKENLDYDVITLSACYWSSF